MHMLQSCVHTPYMAQEGSCPVYLQGEFDQATNVSFFQLQLATSLPREDFNPIHSLYQLSSLVACTQRLFVSVLSVLWLGGQHTCHLLGRLRKEGDRYTWPVLTNSADRMILLWLLSRKRST